MRLLLLRPSLFSIPNLRQFLHPLSSSSSSSSARKKTMGERTPDGWRHQHRRGGGSIPAGKFSVRPKVEVSESSRLDHRSKTPHSVVPQQWRVSPGRAGSDSSTITRESTHEQSESSRLDRRSKTPHSVVPQQWRVSPGRAGSDSSTITRESTHEQSESSRLSHRSKTPHSVVPQQRRASPGRAGSDSSTITRESTHEPMLPFDICRIVSGGPVKLNPSLRELNRERRKELERSRSVCQHQILRPGMILLKHYICPHDQVTIVQKCRELGMGIGGFYWPGYSDGAKLRLRMMCLGQNWDPESRKYEPMRPIDGAKPPGIPFEFMKLVEGAIWTSRAFLLLDNTSINIDNELPKISPDICIVNFYNSSGRLGLHQDRDESQEGLRRGLPVVSFSIGDSAEFLYGDDRDVDKAEKLVLESGDVLIFGGKSRLIFHGVSAILPDTAPKRLIEETKLRQGRLNLTFRQY